MKRGKFFVTMASAMAVLAAAPAFAADVRCAWGEPGLDAQQAKKSNQTVSLVKGGLVVDDASVAKYVWVFSDGQTISNDVVPTTNLRDLSVRRVFSQAGNVTATLTVYDAANQALGSDATTIQVSNGVTELEATLDNALWYLHTQLVPVGADLVSWRDRNYNEGLVMIANTFLKAGYLASSSNTDDPYIDDVKRIVNNVLAGLYSVAEGTYYCANDEITYGFGPALEALSRSGYDASYATAQGPLGDVIQAMVNWIAWFQLGTSGFDWDGCTITPNPAKTPCPATDSGSVSTAGGWPYLAEGWGCSGSTITKGGADKGTYGDRSVSYWMVTGLAAAEDFATANPTAGITVPATVRQNLSSFLQANNPCVANNFGPVQGWNLIERAGQGLFLYKWLSKDPAYAALADAGNAKVQECRGAIEAWWNSHNYQHGQDHPNAAEICSDVVPGQATCYSHFKNNAWDVGYFDWNNGGVWVSLGTTDDINTFAFKTVAEGVKQYPGLVLTTPPCANGSYPGKLAKNQKFFQDGSIDDTGWVTGYLFGTAWGADALNACK